MKALKVNISMALIALTLLCVSFKPVKRPVAGKKVRQAELVNYRDGLYVGKSQDGYAGMEPFWGIVRIKVENGVFTSVNFMIRDTSIHECVDSLYGINHYASYPAYQVQCVKDGKGIKNYPKKLMQTQDISKVDATSGATWSYNIFKASVKEALLTNQTGVLKGNEAGKVSVKVYPNPSDSDVVIEYNLTSKSHVDLSIFNEEGQLIKQLVNKVQDIGPYTVRWEDCPMKGIYFYHLQAGETAIKGPLLGVK